MTLVGDPSDVTILLRAWSGGDDAALDRLAERVYGEFISWPGAP